jgi:hypothetical protein
MNNIQDTLLFPVRDAEARKQFLIACAVALSMFIIPILPMLLLMGYCARIMRQVINERKEPSMPEWQGSDWSEMLMDGLRLYGGQFVLMLPLLILMGCGMISLFSGSMGFAAIADDSSEALGAVGMLFMMIGIAAIVLMSILSLPYSVVVSAAVPHIATKRSFQAAFEFKEWFAIFRKALGPFLLSYAIILVASFIFTFIMQIAAMTIILLCIVPFIMIPYVAYQLIVMNTVFAQAYLAGRDGLQAA